MKKLLVLGASGLVGSRVSELMTEAGYEIFAPSSSELDLTLSGEFEQYSMDHRKDLVGATVINFVAYTNVDEAEKEQGREDGMVYRLNATAVGEVAEWCREIGERLIHISTEYVFDGTKEESAYLEDDKPNPLGWYGQTKLIGEQLVQADGSNNLILRISMPYGSRSERKKDLGRILLDRLRNGLPIKAVNDAKISPLFVDDLAEVLKKVVENKDIHGIYHVGPADSMTLEQFVRVLAKKVGISETLVSGISFEDYWKEKYSKGAARRPKNSWLNSSKLAGALDLKFNNIEINIQEWLKQANHE